MLTGLERFRGHFTVTFDSLGGPTITSVVLIETLNISRLSAPWKQQLDV